MKLNLGCGRDARPGFINVDRAHLPGVDVVADLNGPLPFKDDSADEMVLSHVLEHLSDPLAVMQELHRIAKPEGVLTVSVPYGTSDDAWEDPTHRRPYFLKSFNYFAQPWYWRADYGYRGDWLTEEIGLLLDDRMKGKTADEAMQAVRTERNVVVEMMVRLIAVKPIREPRSDLQTPMNISLHFR